MSYWTWDKRFCKGARVRSTSGGNTDSPCGVGWTGTLLENMWEEGGVVYVRWDTWHSVLARYRNVHNLDGWVQGHCGLAVRSGLELINPE